MKKSTFKKVACLIISISLLLLPLTVNASLLKYGDDNEQVLYLQQNLQKLGHFEVEPTGFFGEITEASLKSFQSAEGLLIDGIAGEETQARLMELAVSGRTQSLTQMTQVSPAFTNSNGNSIVKMGDSNETVRIYQSKLRLLGLFDHEPTGYFGEITENAVVRFQQSFGLTVDGTVGDRTAQLMNNVVDKLLEDLFTMGDLTTDATGRSVTILQNALYSMGYFDYDSTGYYGDLTATAVRNFQADYGLLLDGVAGKDTLKMIQKVLLAEEGIQRNNRFTNSLDMRWFGGVENFFKIEDVARILDVRTGRSFYVKRTFGYNHADVETLTAQDTAVMKQIYGGTWSWDRRPVLVFVHGHVIAGSMAGMPHAGRDDMPVNTWVTNRSGGYGTGANLDMVKGNHMDGHFDLHFTNSRTHASNIVCPRHQGAIREAINYGRLRY